MFSAAFATSSISNAHSDTLYSSNSQFSGQHVRQNTISCPRRWRRPSVKKQIQNSSDRGKDFKPPRNSNNGKSNGTSKESSSKQSINIRKSRPKTTQTGTVYFLAIANEFSMASLYRRLLQCHEEYGGLQCSAIGSVLRVVKPSRPPYKKSETFIFPYGCIVVWGTETDRDDFLSLVVEDALELRSVPAIDNMNFVYGNRTSKTTDVITLEASSDISINTEDTNRRSDVLEPYLERLAVSCALAQSIKLAAFESAMRMTIENTRHLPEELATTGEITASRREVSRLMGRLFLDRYRYHLSGDLLMTPAFFWENEQYLPAYKRMERYLEVRERGEILNKRAEVVQELYTLLGDELTNQHSIALEVAITAMIAFEILLTLITLAKESMRSIFSACALFICLIVIAWVVAKIYRRRKTSNALNKFSAFPRNPFE